MAVDERIFDYVTPQEIEWLKTTRFTYKKTPEQAIADLIVAGHDPELIRRYLKSLLGNADMDEVAGPKVEKNNYQFIDDSPDVVR